MSPKDWQQRYGQGPWQLIRHAVSIVGTVTDALSHAPIVGALIEITAGPPAFEARRAALDADPALQQAAERPDRRLSRADGSYFFLDLPAGDYTLKVSAPRLGTRYGTASLAPVHMAEARDEGQRLAPVHVDAALPPTRIRGQVTRSDSGQPVAGAKVRLRGDNRVALTDGDGRYLLSDLVAGAPTVEVSAKHFAGAALPVDLKAGQEQVMDIGLKPV